MVEFSSVELLKACLAIIDGVTIIPEITVRCEIAQGELCVLPWEEAHMETAVLMVRSQREMAFSFIGCVYRYFKRCHRECVSALPSDDSLGQHHNNCKDHIQLKPARDGFIEKH